MHPEADRFSERAIRGSGPWDGARVLDVGGRDVNGTARDHLARYDDVVCHVLDIRDAPDVEYVGDARTWTPGRQHHLVLCTEVLEHVQGWPSVVWTCWRALLPGGLLVLTCAGVGRPPHNATDGGPLPDGEWYRNITEDEIVAVLDSCGYVAIDTDTTVPGDLYATARRP